MPSTIRRDLERDYLELRESNTQTISPFSWRQNHTDPPYFTSSTDNTDSSCHTSHLSPSDLSFPPKTYALPSSVDSLTGAKSDAHKREEHKEDNFSFGTFEEWMRWDEPAVTSLSPTCSRSYLPAAKTEPPEPVHTYYSGASSGDMLDERGIFPEEKVMEIESPIYQTQDLEKELETQREHLYSTPLSWTRPTLAQIQQLPQETGHQTSTLSPQEEQRLTEIAMPSHTHTILLTKTNTYQTSPSTSSSPGLELEPGRYHAQAQSHKRKSISSDGADSTLSQPHTSSDNGNGNTERHIPVKKTAHNVIEKRYRTNLNDKIAALRDSVPSLRVMKVVRRSGEGQVKPGRGESERGEREDLQGLEAACKLNKATILSKATEYISHLEKRNRYLDKENIGLKDRLDAFELLYAATRDGGPQSFSQGEREREREQQQREQQQQQQIQMQNERRSSNIETGQLQARGCGKKY